MLIILVNLDGHNFAVGYSPARPVLINRHAISAEALTAKTTTLSRLLKTDTNFSEF